MDIITFPDYIALFPSQTQCHMKTRDNCLILTALTNAVPVSMEPSLESPILNPITCAPGAIPFLSGSAGKFPAAIQAT